MTRSLPFAVLAICGALAGQQTLLDDFTAGNDALWQRVDRLAGTGLGTTAYTVPNGRYRIATSAALPALPQLVATGSAYLASIGNPTLFTTGRLQATIRLDNDATNAIVTTRYDLNTQSGYAFTLNNVENRIYITTVSGTTSATLASTPLPISANTDYVLAAESQGNRHSLKVWPLASPEPPLPQLTVTNSTFANGAVGLAVYNQASNLGGIGGQLSAQFDDITFTHHATITPYGTGCPGSWNGTPAIAVSGQPTGGGVFSLDLSQGPANSLAALLVGFLPTSIPLGACTWLVDPGTSISLILPTTGSGLASQPLSIPLGYSQLRLHAQYFVLDAPNAFAASRAIELVFP